MLFKINPKLNLKKLAKQYAKNKKIVIENFLEEESAEVLYNFLNRDMPEDWWSASYKDFTKKGEVKFLPRSSNNIPEIELQLMISQQTFAEGIFCYFFDRTRDNHYETCQCIECQYRKFVSSEETIKWFSELIDFDLSKTGEFFASRFLANHFLSPHHDEQKGKIATVLGLSKDWKPEWGGCLHFLEEDYKTLVRSVQPGFNKLSIFDIPTANGVPHYVSHVAPNVTQGRISFTGWYS